MGLNIAGHQTARYAVSTPVYEGPLDLLLQLIERAELDITALALAQVTDQYLSYIHEMQVPAGEISAFLVVAAKLIQIKSEALLPRQPIREVGEEDPGESLARQLRIYKRFKELATWMTERQAQNFHTYLRLAPSQKVNARTEIASLSLVDLVNAAHEVFSETAHKDALDTVIAPPRITIREKIAWLSERLTKSEKTTFRTILDGSTDRLEIIVTFLALLELIKRYKVSACQENIFSDIQIEKNEDFMADEELEIEFE